MASLRFATGTKKITRSSNSVWSAFFVTIETRIRVSPTRYRVPDLCVYETEPEEQVFHTPPLLAVEILSPEDRMSRMQQKLEDYHRMGCAHIWVLDPWRKKAYRFEGKALVEHETTLSAGPIVLGLDRIFAA